MEEKKKELHPFLKKVLERGIPVWHAEFHSAVNNSDNVPENYFSSKSNVKSRHVQMWWINGDGLVCFHKDEYFMVPAASVRFFKFE